jgi:hypothetical protein
MKGVKNSKKQTIENYKRPILKHPKSSFYVVMLLLDFKDDLKNLEWHSYNTFNRLK